MNEYSLSGSSSQKKIFLMKLSEIKGRLDPSFNFHLKNSSWKSKFEEENLYKISKPFSGGTPSKDVLEYWNGDIPWVSPKDFKSLYISSSEDYITKEGLENSSTKLVPANSVLIVVRSGILVHTLPVAINKVPVTINQDLKAFVIKDKRVIPEYIGIYFYVFGKKLLPLISKHGSTVQSINTEQFSKIKIPIPDKDTQQEIINKINISINNSNNKRTEARKLLENIDLYMLQELGITLPLKDKNLSKRIFTTNFKSVSGGRLDPKLYDSHTQSLRAAIANNKFKSLPLKKLITHSAAGDWGYDENEDLGESYVKCLVIRATEFDNLYNLNLENSRIKYRLIHLAKLDKINVRKNDLLIEKSGGSPDQPVGRIAIIEDSLLENNQQLCYSNFILKIRVEEALVIPNYLFCFLKTVHNIKLTEAMQSQTNGIRNLIMSNYLNQQIPLPDITKQKEISDHISLMRAKAKSLFENARSETERVKLEIQQIIFATQEIDQQLVESIA